MTADTTTASQPSLIAAVAKSCDMTQAEVRRVLDDYGLAVTRELAAGRRVRLPVLGTLSAKDTPARSGTIGGKPYSKPAGRRIAFAPGQALKAAVSGGD